MIVLTILVLLSCAESVDGSDIVNNGEPYIALLSPTEGDTVCGTPLRVEVEVANIELVEPVEDAAQAEPGTGHVDIMLNGQDASMVWVTETDISNTADGEWQLKVELSYADHTPVVPYAGDLAYITVSSEVCR
jgi:hypothetical protein